jgi:putative addiction module component (TIGR02574 family)
MKINDIPEISGLTKPEMILLVEDIWENISSDDSDISVPESHRKELLKRLNAPGALLTLDELKANIQK